jgi:hypothetical protein
LAERLRLLRAGKALWKLRTVLHRLEPGFRVRIVVADARTAVRTGTNCPTRTGRTLLLVELHMDHVLAVPISAGFPDGANFVLRTTHLLSRPIYDKAGEVKSLLVTGLPASILTRGSIGTQERPIVCPSALIRLHALQ